jgi:hypothetical protein
MNPKIDEVDDEKYMTELTIAPDGRIYVFGLSGKIVDVLLALEPTNQALLHLAERAHEAQHVEGA